MYLTREEEQILDGEKGAGIQKALKIIVKVAEALGAERLVKIKAAHVSGISYKNIGDEGLALICGLARENCRVTVPTTVNPAGVDLEKWREMHVPKEFVDKQAKIIRCLAKIGATPILSCIPYKIAPPRQGDQVAWGESNAVLYANSVLSARTEREGGPLALFEAIAGRAPYIGLRTDEGRKPTIIVTVEKSLETVNPAALGYAIGALVEKGVPYIKGAKKILSNDYKIRLFLAAIGASSGIGLAIIEGVSPEALKNSVEGLERISIGPLEVDDQISRISTEIDRPDAVALGCPHLTPENMEKIEKVTGGKDIRRLILFTSRPLISRCRAAVASLESRGARVYCDTCMVVSDLARMGVERVIVDSAKAAYYLSAQGFEVELADTLEAVRKACL